MGGKLTAVRSDSAPEIVAGEGAKVAASLGIEIEPSSKKFPAASGKHECAVQRVIHRARAAMLCAP